MIIVTGLESVTGPGLMSEDGQRMNKWAIVCAVGIYRSACFDQCLTRSDRSHPMARNFIERLHTACTGLEKMCRGCLLGLPDAWKP